MKTAGSKPQITYLCEQPSWNFRKKDGANWCKTCQRCIPDLREASPETIQELLRRDGGETCGTFYPDQFEINAATQKSPPVFRIVLAAALSFFTAEKLSSQTVIEPVKTEQTDSSTAISSDYQPANTPADSSIANSADASSYRLPMRYRKLHLFTIGAWHYYLNWRFPFLHIKRYWRGRFKY